MKELHIEPVLDYIQHFQKQWKNHLQQMSATQFPKSSFTIDQMEKKVCEIITGLMAYNLFG
jgi:hypothetical protein